MLVPLAEAEKGEGRRVRTGGWAGGRGGGLEDQDMGSSAGATTSWLHLPEPWFPLGEP